MEKPYAARIAEERTEEADRIIWEGLNYYANKIRSTIEECYEVDDAIILAALKITSKVFEQQLSEEGKKVAQKIIENTACFVFDLEGE